MRLGVRAWLGVRRERETGIRVQMSTECEG